MPKIGVGVGAANRSHSAATPQPDTTAPVLSSLAWSTPNLTGNLDEGGTVYGYILNSATPQSGSSIAAATTSPGYFTGAISSGSPSVNVGSDATIQAAALAAYGAGTHHWHVTVKDAAGNYSTDAQADYVVAAAGIVFKTSNAGGNSNTAGYTHTLPTNAAGEFMYAIVVYPSNKPILTPSGWSLFYTGTARLSGGPELKGFKKTSAGAETTVQIDPVSGFTGPEVVVMVYTGVTGEGTPPTNVLQSTGNTCPSPTIASAVANSIVLSIFSSEVAALLGTDTISGTGNTTRQVGGNGYYYLSVGEHGPVSAGATTARTGTHSGVLTGVEWNAATLELLA